MLELANAEILADIHNIPLANRRNVGVGDTVRLAFLDGKNLELLRYRIVEVLVGIGETNSAAFIAEAVNPDDFPIPRRIQAESRHIVDILLKSSSDETAQFESAVQSVGILEDPKAIIDANPHIHWVVTHIGSDPVIHPAELALDDLAKFCTTVRYKPRNEELE
jgi:hypothetical protein